MTHIRHDRVLLVCCCMRSTIPLLDWKPGQRKSWVTMDTRKLIKKREGLIEGPKKIKLDWHWTWYRDISNCAQQQTRKDHMSYVTLMTRNAKSFWRWIKNIKAPNSIIPEIVHRGQVANSDVEKADIFNNFFCSMFTREHMSALADLKAQLPYSLHSITTVSISADDVFR